MTKMSENEIISELNAIAQRGPKKLSSADAQAAKELLRELRKQGYSDQEISELTHSRWSPTTIRVYTKGIAIDKSNSTIKANLMQNLGKLVNADIPIEDIGAIVDIKKKCDLMGINIQDIGTFMQACSSASISPASIVEQVLLLSKNKVSVDRVAETVETVLELGKRGFDLDTLDKVKILSQSVSGKEFLKTGDIHELKLRIEQEVEKLSAERAALVQEIESAQAEQTAIEERRKTAQSLVDIYLKLESAGVTEPMLNSLAQTSEKFGGVQNMLAAINEFADIASMRARKSELARICQDSESDIRKLQTKYSSIAEASAMCETLLYAHNFNVDAIIRITNLAKAYGDSSSVIKALSAYGDLKNIQKKTSEAQSLKRNLLAEIGELRKQKDQLNAEIQAIKSANAQKIFGELPQKISDQFRSSLQPALQYVQNFVNTMESNAAKYYLFKGEANALGQELGLFRIFQSARVMSNVRTPDAPNIAFDFLNAAGNLCKANYLNPKVRINDICRNKYPIPSYTEIELLDLLVVAGYSLKYLAGNSSNGYNGVATTA